MKYLTNQLNFVVYLRWKDCITRFSRLKNINVTQYNRVKIV